VSNTVFVDDSKGLGILGQSRIGTQIPSEIEPKVLENIGRYSDMRKGEIE
jgi:hypothetical protein